MQVAMNPSAITNISSAELREYLQKHPIGKMAKEIGRIAS